MHPNTPRWALRGEGCAGPVFEMDGYVQIPRASANDRQWRLWMARFCQPFRKVKSTKTINMTWYSFTVRGVYPSGSKATIDGHVHVDGDDYPQSAFDLAVKTCQDTTPGLIVDTTKPGRVTLRKLKGKPRR